MTHLRLLTIAASLLMLTAIAAAISGGGFVTEGRDLLASNWRRLTVIDLSVGIALFSAFVLWRERSTTSALAWIAAFVVSGNLATAGYLLWSPRDAESRPTDAQTAFIR